MVLFETPTRFAVFKVLNKGKLDKIKDLWKEFTTSDLARKSIIHFVQHGGQDAATPCSVPMGLLCPLVAAG